MNHVSEVSNQFSMEGFCLGSLKRIHGVVDIGYMRIDIEGSEEFLLEDVAFFAQHKPVLHLSLHPQWFYDPGYAYNQVRRVASVYSQHLGEGYQPVNIDGPLGNELVFLP